MKPHRALLAFERAVGSKIAHHTPTSSHGGAKTEQILLADGRAVFLKSHSEAPREMFVREAEGLAFLREASVLRIPNVLAASDVEGESFIALELVSPARVASDFDEQLGRGLAELHRYGAPSFGFSHDNFLATLVQENASSSSWPTFYATRRLEPLFRSAANRGLFSSRARADFERLIERIDELASTSEPPSRLHGDLWSGNVIVDESGHPCLIDPAVYGGQREIDLAMMKLFGGFSQRVFDAYAESWPLEPGHERRVSLYQLYPLLAHVHLFGGGYVASVERELARCLR